jgi:co-chaperonin GroES (HSP10)
MSLQQTFKIVYNDCYGGFDLSSYALNEYNQRTSKNIVLPDYIDREDLVLINMIETIHAKDLNSKNSKLKIIEFDIKFKDFLLWYEYDGKETVSIDYDKYIVQNVKLILDTNILPDEKIQLITNLYTDLDKLKCLECSQYVCVHITTASG